MEALMVSALTAGCLVGTYTMVLVIALTASVRAFLIKRLCRGVKGGSPPWHTTLKKFFLEKIFLTISKNIPLRGATGNGAYNNGSNCGLSYWNLNNNVGNYNNNIGARLISQLKYEKANSRKAGNLLPAASFPLGKNIHRCKGALVG